MTELDLLRRYYKAQTACTKFKGQPEEYEPMARERDSALGALICFYGGDPIPLQLPTHPWDLFAAAALERLPCPSRKRVSARYTQVIPGMRLQANAARAMR